MEGCMDMGLVVEREIEEGSADAEISDSSFVLAPTSILLQHFAYLLNSMGFALLLIRCVYLTRILPRVTSHDHSAEPSIPVRRRSSKNSNKAECIGSWGCSEPRLRCYKWPQLKSARRPRDGGPFI